MTAVLAVLEQRDRKLRKVSFETVTAARTLADKLGGTVDAVVMADGAIEGLDLCGRYGADRVLLRTSAHFARYSPEGQCEVLGAMVNDYAATVFAATATGKDLSPRVSARSGLPLVADAIELDVDSGRVTALRPVYSGKAEFRVQVTVERALVTVRPNVFTPLEQPRAAAQEEQAVELARAPRVRVVQIKAPDQATLDVAEAPIVVSGGRGLQKPENFNLVEDLARAIGPSAAVGASRAVVDAGWRPHSDQVGQTGKTVSPQLYFAVGISGAVQHLAGMRTAKTIVAINKDADAPIFKVADFGIVGDLFEIVPRLTEEIRKVRTS